MIANVHEFSERSIDTAAMLVILTLERITLAVPQSDIAALEPVLDVQTSSDNKSSAAGVLVLQEQRCPVYALGAELDCLPTIPANYRVCALLQAPTITTSFAIACIDVRIMPRAVFAAHGLPRMLEKQQTPVRSLLTHDNRLVLETTAVSLFTHVKLANANSVKGDTAADGALVSAEIISFDERARRVRVPPT